MCEQGFSLSSVVCVCVRSKRSRRGPVIEADGMLKMFHCPYEGCSQVYVAISSFQVSSRVQCMSNEAAAGESLRAQTNATEQTVKNRSWKIIHCIMR